MREMKTIHSQPEAGSIRQLVADHYGSVTPLRCTFHIPGLHDNYLIESDSGRYILRLYRNSWRSQQEIQFELELLSFLDKNSAPVAGPVRTMQGELSFGIECPEGERVAALFNYAPGDAPGNSISNDEAVLLGRAVANIHLLTETFSTSCKRPVLDIPYLLDTSINSIAPFIDSDGLAYLKDVQDRLHNTRPRIPDIPGTFGICIGDVNPTNFHVDNNKHLTLFDFDQCGYGYRAFEIGKFFSSIHRHKKKRDIEGAFLDAYHQVRQLNEAEHKAIPYFEMISVIWVMAIHASNADCIGHKHLEKPFWDRRLALMKELDGALLN